MTEFRCQYFVIIIVTVISLISVHCLIDVAKLLKRHKLEMTLFPKQIICCTRIKSKSSKSHKKNIN